MTAPAAWRLHPTRIVASDRGWGEEAALDGTAVAALRAFHGHDDGATLADARLPRHVVLGRGVVPGSSLVCLRTGLMLTSDAVARSIAAHDGARHRFWPVAVTDADGRDAGRWHGLIVRAFATAIDLDRSDTRTVRPDPTLGGVTRVTVTGRVAIHPDRMPDAHLWWDQAPTEPVLLCSAALAGDLPADMGCDPCR
ncbi:imm11 family protein [Jannaschia sp. LMIT008]|uniref:imm11 family protein n=1 Tax=Jannaschia maritima TaxID=3032585 RepID=UPI002811CB8C|nr:DUF1629 domain-containing protein [Jannaschia sp. LMIT008]